jgi:hypothetical protein
MKDKLKEAYQRWCKETRRNGSTLVGGSVYEFFEWLDESKQDGWVSVEERLPEHNQKVLFALHSGDIRMGLFMLNDPWDRKNMFCDGAYFSYGKITHWQPLPAPPSTDKQ